MGIMIVKVQGVW